MIDPGTAIVLLAIAIGIGVLFKNGGWFILSAVIKETFGGR